MYLEARELERAGELTKAVDMLEQVVQRAPNERAPRNDLAVLYKRQRRYSDALREFHAVSTRFPTDVQSANEVAFLLSFMGHQAVALATAKRALALDSTNATTLHTLALILLQMGQPELSRDTFASALSLAPDRAGTRMEYGMACVAMGDWLQGWAELEVRETALGSATVFKALPTSPRWNGIDSIEGKRLLIVQEQGLGDSIMCARFATVLAARGATVLLHTMEPLVDLLGTVDGVTACFAGTGEFPPHDLHVPLMSLMHRLQVTPDTLRGDAYLAPQGECPAHLAARLPRDGTPTVLLTWSGNPEHANNHRRSIRGELLAPLLALPGVRFVALQKAPEMHAVLPSDLHNRVVDVGAECTSFHDSAHALRRADLVVTVDTAVAHLSGAIGAPTLVCLPFCPDYRWGMTGSTTPWYESVTLMRQPEAGAWSAVIKDVIARVQALPTLGGR